MVFARIWFQQSGNISKKLKSKFHVCLRNKKTTATKNKQTNIKNRKKETNKQTKKQWEVPEISVIWCILDSILKYKYWRFFSQGRIFFLKLPLVYITAWISGVSFLGFGWFSGFVCLMIIRVIYSQFWFGVNNTWIMDVHIDMWWLQ